MAGLTVGSHVELADGRFAIVRFIGQPHFAEGDWVGIELDESSGKNDGSVQGERYFECEMGKGMFIRPQALTVIESRAPPKPVAPKRVGRPPSVVAPAKRASVQDPAGGKRMSMNAASPSPAARLSRPSSILRVSLARTFPAHVS
jgi:dynactin 1